MNKVVNFRDYAVAETAIPMIEDKAEIPEVTEAPANYYDDAHCLFPGLRRAWWALRGFWALNGWWIIGILFGIADMAMEGYYNATTVLLIWWDHVMLTFSDEVIPAFKELIAEKKASSARKRDINAKKKAINAKKREIKKAERRAVRAERRTVKAEKKEIKKAEKRAVKAEKRAARAVNREIRRMQRDTAKPEPSPGISHGASWDGFKRAWAWRRELISEMY